MKAALLHDTVEDTDTTPAELEAKFGAIVARIVQEVTDDKSLPKQEREASPGWTAERVQEYFVWSSEVVKGLKGTNSALENKLEVLFNRRGVQL
ncbi:unnamed protein product [Lampetra planeri]